MTARTPSFNYKNTCKPCTHTVSKLYVYLTTEVDSKVMFNLRAPSIYHTPNLFYQTQPCCSHPLGEPPPIPSKDTA